MTIFTSTTELNITNDTTNFSLAGDAIVLQQNDSILVLRLGGATATLRGDLSPPGNGLLDSFEIITPDGGRILYDDLDVTVQEFINFTSSPFFTTLNPLFFDGDDRLTGSRFDDILSGLEGNDVLFGGGGEDLISGGIGNDRLFGNTGGDTLFGGSGSDTLSGDEGGDEIFGGFGGDRLLGGAGNDRLSGGTARDILLGGAGNDTMLAGDGNDVMFGAEGRDDYFGGAGFDTLFMRGSTKVNRVDLAGTLSNLGDAAGDTFDSVENIIGGRNRDILFGDDVRNVLNGNEGADVLLGRGGNDLLRGGDGDDRLVGHDGRDIMTGGAGNDRFQFLSADDTGLRGQRDIITDFFTNGDVIELNRIDADTTRDGNQAFDFIAGAKFTGTAGELRVERDTDTHLLADTDGDGEADFGIVLTGRVGLGDEDFLL